VLVFRLLGDGWFCRFSRHVAPMVMKFGVLRSTHPRQTSPRRCKGGGVAPKTENFKTKFRHINAPCAIFIPNFLGLWAVPELWQLTLGCIFPSFQRPIGETVRWMRNRIASARKIRTSSITVPSMVRLWLRASPGDEKVRFLCIFCLSVSLLNGKVCERDFAMKTFGYGSGFDTVGLGLVCRSVLYTRVQLCLFAARWRHHRMLKIKSRPNLFFFRPSKATQLTDLDEIWQVSINYRYILHAKFGTHRWKRWVQKPQILKFGQICVFRLCLYEYDV